LLLLPARSAGLNSHALALPLPSRCSPAHAGADGVGLGHELDAGSAQGSRNAFPDVPTDVTVPQLGGNRDGAAELVALVSGQSLRAGYATSTAARDMPGYRIQQHTRHKSAQMVVGYIREADKWTKSGLKGVGF
jgi:hypothetical protein